MYEIFKNIFANTEIKRSQIEWVSEMFGLNGAKAPLGPLAITCILKVYAYIEDYPVTPWRDCRPPEADSPQTILGDRSFARSPRSQLRGMRSRVPFRSSPLDKGLFIHGPLHDRL